MQNGDEEETCVVNRAEDPQQGNCKSVIEALMMFFFCMFDIVGDRMESLKTLSRSARKVQFSGRRPGFSCGSHTPNRSLGVWDGARGFHADPTHQTAFCCIPSNSASYEHPAPRSRRTYVSHDSVVVEGLNCQTPGAGTVKATACSGSPALHKALSFVHRAGVRCSDGPQLLVRILADDPTALRWAVRCPPLDLGAASLPQPTVHVPSKARNADISCGYADASVPMYTI